MKWTNSLCILLMILGSIYRGVCVCFRRGAPGYKSRKTAIRIHFFISKSMLRTKTLLSRLMRQCVRMVRRMARYHLKSSDDPVSNVRRRSPIKWRRWPLWLWRAANRGPTREFYDPPATSSANPQWQAMSAIVTDGRFHRTHATKPGIVGRLTAHVNSSVNALPLFTKERRKSLTLIKFSMRACVCVCFGPYEEIPISRCNDLHTKAYFTYDL